MKISWPILTALLLLTLSCNASDTPAINAATVQQLIPHYFGKGANISDKKHPNFVSGDFNNDGTQDIAILFQPDASAKPNTQVKTSTPWQFPGSEKSNKYSTSLAIINGERDGFLSTQTKVFGLLDYSGVLETPSFELILVKSTDEEYREYQAMLKDKTNGDILILPTEAGIDTYIYWNKDKYEFFVPEEVP